MQEFLKFGPVRVMWASLVTPRVFKDARDGGGKPKLNITVLIPKTNKTMHAQIKKYIETAINDSSEKKGVKQMQLKNAFNTDPDNDLCAIRDGDLLNQKNANLDKAVYEAYKGHWVVNCKRPVEGFSPPLVTDHACNKIPRSEIDSEIYSGCWVRIAASAYAYTTPKQSASLTLQQVQKVRDDEPLNGISNQFEAIEDEGGKEATDGEAFSESA